MSDNKILKVKNPSKSYINEDKQSEKNVKQKLTKIIKSKREKENINQ